MLFGGWLDEALWVAEIGGGIVDGDGKSAGRYGRLLYRVETWSDQTARLFAADCAESTGLKDGRAKDAILAARRFAFGLISSDDLAAAEHFSWGMGCDGIRVAAFAAQPSAQRSAFQTASYAVSLISRALAIAKEEAEIAQVTRLGQYLRGEVDLDAIRRSVTPCRKEHLEQINCRQDIGSSYAIYDFA